MTDEEKMMDILQSFVDLGKTSSIKEDLKDDIEATEWAIKKINTLKTERDYYKQRYLEFNDYFLKNNMTIEEMLKDLKRSKLYERGTKDDIQSCKDKKIIGVVGLGYVGMPIAVAFAKKIKVVGYDLNKKKIAYENHKLKEYKCEICGLSE